MAEKEGDQLTIADCLSQIGVWAELNGFYEDALEKYEQVLPVFKRYGDKWHHLEYLLRLAGLAFLRGDIEKTRSVVAEVQAAITRYNLVTVPPHVIEHLAMLRCLEEDYQGAVEIAIIPRLHFYPPTIFALQRSLIYGYCGLGDFETAEKFLRLALETAQPLKAKGFQVQCLPGAALIAAADGQFARAAELLSLAFHHQAGATGWLEIVPLIVQLRSRLQTELDPDTFSAAWEQGKQLDLETAVSQIQTP
jgi:tetratricopeptide (TPR) repeat protein